MNKTELIKHIVEKARVTEYQAEVAFKAFEEAIVQTLANNGKVELKGFGVFSMKQRAKRQGRNPKTGEPITIAAKKVPVFKASKTLKDRIFYVNY